MPKKCQVSQNSCRASVAAFALAATGEATKGTQGSRAMYFHEMHWLNKEVASVDETLDMLLRSKGGC